MHVCSQELLGEATGCLFSLRWLVVKSAESVLLGPACSLHNLWTKIPAITAVVAAEPLVECVPKPSPSPASFRVSLSHLAPEEDVTGCVEPLVPRIADQIFCNPMCVFHKPPDKQWISSSKGAIMTYGLNLPGLACLARP